MLQDFNFKIVHKVRARRANVDALSCNPVDSHDEDEDFGMEIHDDKKDVEMVDAEINPIDVSNSEEDNEVGETGKQMDIWKDETYMVLLSRGIMDQVLDDAIEVDRAKRRWLNYHWKEDTLFFKNLVVPKPKERQALVKNIHEEIGHFSEGRILAELMVEKIKLTFDMDSSLLENVDKTQKRQRRNYATGKGKQEFVGLDEGKTMIKMRKPGKKRALLANWEGSYVFVKYKDKKGCREFDDGCQVCILKGIDGKQWECVRRDLQVFN
ncbi:unnamed protein product [Sphagnum balticum]